MYEEGTPTRLVGLSSRIDEKTPMWLLRATFENRQYASFADGSFRNRLKSGC
jgi:hypothetical protein